jgi:hypothetical protein
MVSKAVIGPRKIREVMLTISAKDRQDPSAAK